VRIFPFPAIGCDESSSSLLACSSYHIAHAALANGGAGSSSSIGSRLSVSSVDLC
jgi:hypothetical protein